MKTFLKWAEEKKLDLPVFNDSTPSEKTTAENARRTGISPNYPKGYSRGQYTDLDNVTHKATAALELSQKPNPKYGGPRAAN